MIQKYTLPELDGRTKTRVFEMSGSSISPAVERTSSEVQDVNEDAVHRAFDGRQEGTV